MLPESLTLLMSTPRCYSRMQLKDVALHLERT